MRYLTIIAAAFGLIVLAAPAGMAATPGLGLSGNESGAIQQVDSRCGPNRHYVRHHHHYQGHWVGRCIAG